MNGRAKGCRGEREVAKLIAEWWGSVEPGGEFVRTPSSGGWATPQLRGAFRAAGDLMTTAATWPFTVEVKYRENWKDGTLLAGMKSPVWGWWAQAVKAAEEEGRQPMLWLRRSREPWRVMLPKAALVGPTRLPGVVWSRYPGKGRPSVEPILVAWEALRGLPPGAFAR